LGAPKPIFALKLWETGSSFGENFGGEWKYENGRPSGDLPSMKIWKGSDKNWGRYYWYNFGVRNF